jgi:high-affinity nickel-transport protein
VIGLVHGLAGTAGLMLAVLATIPTRPLALLYVAMFGCGSIGGMMAMSAVLALPFALAAPRLRRLDGVLAASAAVASVAVGLSLAWRIGVEAGVFA